MASRHRPKRADYYLPRFASAASGGRYSRWHWPALFVTGSWFLYRKMWGWAFIYLIGLPILTSILFIVLAGTTSTSTFAWLTSLWILLVLATPPLVANRLYFGHCRNLIEGAKERFSDRSRQLAYLASKGGTSGGIALTVVAGLTCPRSSRLALCRYREARFIRRARVSEAVAVADGVAKEVGSFYEANGSFPTDFSAIRDSAGTSKYLISIELNRVNGVIAFYTRPERDSTIAFTLTPSAGPDKHISWKCALR